jgi:hypothetical protein
MRVGAGLPFSTASTLSRASIPIAVRVSTAAPTHGAPFMGTKRMRRTTLLELVRDLQRRTSSEAELVRRVRRLVNSGAVVLTGNFAGQRSYLFPRGCRGGSGRGHRGCAACRRSHLSADDAVEQDGKDDERHRDVEPIALQREGNNREGNPGHGSGKEQHEAELDQAAAAFL